MDGFLNQSIDFCLFKILVFFQICCIKSRHQKKSLPYCYSVLCSWQDLFHIYLAFSSLLLSRNVYRQFPYNILKANTGSVKETTSYPPFVKNSLKSDASSISSSITIIEGADNDDNGYYYFF